MDGKTPSWVRLRSEFEENINLVDLDIDDRSILNVPHYSRMCAVQFKLSFIGIVYEEGRSIPWLRAVHVGFVVDKVALGKFLFRTSVVPCHDVPPMMRTDSTLIQQKAAPLNSTHKQFPNIKCARDYQLLTKISVL